MLPWVVTGFAVLVAVGVLAWAWPILHAHRRQARERRDIERFRLERERLEAKFFDLARGLGKPRGLRWVQCDWQPEVTFARDVRTGMLTAFVSVNVHFEAVEGGDMEDVEAVGTVRDAAAVFHCRRGVWGTGGRALFNMDPQGALQRLEGQYEPVSAP